MIKSLYVAATGQHVGKTTSTLGLVKTLQDLGYNVGYSKPVGQKYLNVQGIKADKDAVLFADFIGFELDKDLHSPVIIAEGVTAKFIEDSSPFDFPERVVAANERLVKQHELVVFEGTGHPAVGSVVNLSNADVAKMVDAAVVMIVEGGIGRTLDKLSLSLAVFAESDVPVIGVIVNKVKPEKLDYIRKYVGKKLESMGIPLLGVLPYDRALSNPIMDSIMNVVKGRCLLNSERMWNQVSNSIPGSLFETDEFGYEDENNLLVVSAARLGNVLEKVAEISEEKGHPIISGVLITGDGRLEHWFESTDIWNPFLEKYRIPVVSSPLDALGAVVRINQIEVKINTRTPWKVQKAVQLIREHVDLYPLLESLGAKPKNV